MPHDLTTGAPGDPSAGSLEMLRRRRPEILRLAAARGVGTVRVFGSVARQEQRPDSDIDLLVDLESGRSLFDLGGFAADVEDLIGRRVDVVTVAGLRPRLLERVLSEAVAL